MPTRPAPPDDECRLGFGTIDGEQWKIADYEAVCIYARSTGSVSGAASDG